jgi:hypothetical protein
MWCLGRLACVGVCWVGLALTTANSACAGAWTRAQGEGIVIVTTARHVAPMGAVTGRPISSDTNIGQIYLEYGLLDRLTIGAKSYIELSSTDLNGSSAALGGFVRKRVWQDGRGSAGSIQFGYSHPIESLLGSTFALAEPGAVPEAPSLRFTDAAGRMNGAAPSSRPARPTICAVTVWQMICASN